jgi:hypothetical protein
MGAGCTADAAVWDARTDLHCGEKTQGISETPANEGRSGLPNRCNQTLHWRPPKEGI